MTIRQFPIYVIEQLTGTVQAARLAKLKEFEMWAGQSPISQRFHKPDWGGPCSLYYDHPKRPKKSKWKRSALFFDVCSAFRKRSEGKERAVSPDQQLNRPRFGTMDQLIGELAPTVKPLLASYGYPERWDTRWPSERIKNHPDFRLGDRGASVLEAIENFWESGDAHLLYDLQHEAYRTKVEFDRLLKELKVIGFSTAVLFPLMAHFRSVNDPADIPPAPTTEKEMIELYWDIMTANHVTDPRLHKPMNAHLTKLWADRGFKLPT